MRLLHIAAHMGGGAGKAIQTLMAYCAETFGWEQAVALLDWPAQTHHLERCVQSGVQVYYPGQSLEKVLAEADAVILNWWNHPYMSQFLARIPQIPVRLMLWSHVNGCVYPFLPAEFLFRFHRLMFTTPYSLENLAWSSSERETLKIKSDIVYGSGVYDTNAPRKKDYSNEGNFIVGYVGTLSKAKIHPNMATFCKAVKRTVPNVRFVFAGEPDEELKIDLRIAGLDDCVEFSGYVTDVFSLLSEFDVFGYLLSPAHYGTTENAILEAMIYALPVVLMDQGAERFIVKHGVSGLLAKDHQEYADVMAELAGDALLRERIGRAARKTVIAEFDIANNAQRFRDSVESTLAMEKRVVSFVDIIGKTSADWFMSFMPPEDKLTLTSRLLKGTPIPSVSCRKIYLQESKSSVYHFRRCFPEDLSLIPIELALNGTLTTFIGDEEIVSFA